jgi:hypothetical protein
MANEDKILFHREMQQYVVMPVAKLLRTWCAPTRNIVDRNTAVAGIQGCCSIAGSRRIRFSIVVVQSEESGTARGVLLSSAGQSRWRGTSSPPLFIDMCPRTIDLADPTPLGVDWVEPA